ncbi:unnamed protein product [Polarella glacialis]|uniref:Uncharacterized protein n=1 Tax=Polarella glacialis TaxID=89957 RepID=A0A813DWV2_POLGL|nr:unnamed protein product [Polarella glacialis]
MAASSPQSASTSPEVELRRMNWAYQLRSCLEKLCRQCSSTRKVRDSMAKINPESVAGDTTGDTTGLRSGAGSCRFALEPVFAVHRLLEAAGGKGSTSKGKGKGKGPGKRTGLSGIFVAAKLSGAEELASDGKVFMNRKRRRLLRAEE